MVEVGSDIKGLKELAKNSDKLKKNFRRPQPCGLAFGAGLAQPVLSRG